MGKFYKKSDKSDKNCQRHLMRLNAIHDTAKRSKQMNHVFCQKTKNCSPTFPIFNFNSKITNHGFILPQDQEILKYNGFTITNKQLTLSLVSSEESQHIWVPKPKQKICQICKTQYHDYKEHVQSDNHIMNKNSSSFNQHIRQLCRIYGNDQNKKEVETQFAVQKEEKTNKNFYSNEQDNSSNNWIGSVSL